jgi:hypothetical protein
MDRNDPVLTPIDRNDLCGRVESSLSNAVQLITRRDGPRKRFIGAFSYRLVSSRIHSLKSLPFPADLAGVFAGEPTRDKSLTNGSDSYLATEHSFTNQGMPLAKLLVGLCGNRNLIPRL